jgi:hypothetical protein
MRVHWKAYEDRVMSKKLIGEARRPCRFLPCFLVFAVSVSGCGGYTSSAPTYEVKGKVRLANGKALSAGRVRFVAADGQLPEASGEIQPDGGFSLTTRSEGDGAAPGKYKVRIEPAENQKPGRTRPRFPLKYVDEDSSGLAVTVRPEPNQLEPFTLK